MSLKSRKPEIVESLLSLVNLCDRYEVKARLIPGLLVALPLIVAAGTIFQAASDFWETLGLTTASGVVLAIALSHLAAAAGRMREAVYVKQKGGLPTERWLLGHGDCPHATSTTTRWRTAIEKITGLPLPSSDERAENPEEARKKVRDAVAQLRHDLRDRPDTRMVRIANEDYGFARNLAGLRWVWVGTSVAGLALSIAGMTYGLGTAMGVPVNSIFVVASSVCALALPRYMDMRADRYTEALFAAAARVADALPT